MSRKRELALLAGSLVVALLLGELGLRAAGYRYSPLKVMTPLTASDYRFEHVFQTSDFTFDPELIWRPLSNHGVFNLQGFRGHEIHGPKAPGTIRILAVGDSNTLGHQGPHGANWPLFLETFDSRLVVANAGVYGYSSFQGVRRLQETLALEPDIVLISFGANDALVVTVTDAEYARRLARRKRWLRVATASRLGQLAVDVYDKLSARAAGAAPRRHRVDLDEYRENVDRMVALSRAHGARPVLLTRPFQGRMHDPDNWKSVAPDYNRVTREEGEKLGVPVIDVFKEFKRQPRLFEDESHFTVEGHWEAARFVYQALQPLLGTR